MQKNEKIMENEAFLTTQIITYIGNKRSLLDFIGDALYEIKKDINKEKLIIVDIFSGSGIVSRYFKQHATKLIANDLEDYSYTLNKCYLKNKDEIDQEELIGYYNYLIENLNKELKEGFISRLYAPKNSFEIEKDERVFFTTRNANYIDTCRKLIDTLPRKVRPYFIAPLLTEASTNNNTSGVFKGFYKNSKTGIGQFGGNKENALSRIMKDISLPFPIFSNFSCEVEIYKEKDNQLIDKLEEVDVIYMDPPYNQHPYGSNYFMLNLINNYIEPRNISKVSGIPSNWNRSNYNKKKEALTSFSDLCQKAKAKYLLISYNSEGFITKKEMVDMLSKIGIVKVLEKKYNTYRASRNLNNRNIYVSEYLFLVKKG